MSIRDPRFYVYMLFHPLTGVPFWVGKGSGGRVTVLIRALKPNVVQGYAIRYIHRLRKETGVDEIPHVIVRDRLTEDEAFAIETSLIQVLGIKPKGLLINRTRGGPGGGSPGDITKKLLRKAAAKREITDELRDAYRTAERVWTGRNHSEASRAKMRASHKGKVLTEEHRKNISLAQQRRKELRNV